MALVTRRLSLYLASAFAAIIAISSFNASLGAATAPAFPERPIRLVLGFAPGGGLDAVAGPITPKLHEALGQPWVVDHRPGAGGNIATQLVIRANPDGHTVLLAQAISLTANPLIHKSQFDVARDLRAVIMLADGQNIMVIHPSVKAKSLQEFVELAKARPGAFNFASSGIGSAPHLAAELFKWKTGLSIVHVPYKGGGPSLTAVRSGEVEVLFASLPTALPHVRAGNLVALGVMGAKRAAAAPDVPTIRELGFPGIEMTSWYGLLVPSKTPTRTITTIYEAARNALGPADVREQYSRQGLEISVKDPEEFTAQIRAETDAWGKLIKATGIQAD